MLTWIKEWMALPKEIAEQRKLLMSLKDDVTKIIAAMDAATNAIAARIDAITTALDAEVAKLKALGADPANPVPASMDSETTPILDEK